MTISKRRLRESTSGAVRHAGVAHFDQHGTLAKVVSPVIRSIGAHPSHATRS
jgi:hypothetical protein